MNTNTVYHLHPLYRFQWEEAQQCYVLLYPEGMVKLNPSSGEILKCVDGEKSVKSIAEELSIRFEDERVANDVIEFFKVANEQGWLSASA